MSERSFRVSPFRLALLAELVEGLAYECGSGDWPMQQAEATIQKTIADIRARYGDVVEPARDWSWVGWDARGLSRIVKGDVMSKLLAGDILLSLAYMDGEQQVQHMTNELAQVRKAERERVLGEVEALITAMRAKIARSEAEHDICSTDDDALWSNCGIAWLALQLERLIAKLRGGEP